MQMTVYTWLVILLVAASLLLKGNRKQSKAFVIVAFLLLFAVMGLRDVYAFGGDTWGSGGSYPNIYMKIGTSEWNVLYSRGGDNYNIGFTYFTKLVYQLSNGDYQIFISVISILVMAGYMRFIAKYSPSPIQSILCFLGLLFYPFLFDAIKQALAMGVLFFAFDAIIEKKPIRFIVFTLIASLLHFPALVFLPAYWIGRMRLGRKYIATMAALLLLTYIFRNQLLNIMLNAYKDSNSVASMTGIRFLRNKVLLMIAIAVFAVVIRPPSAKDPVYNTLLMFLGVAIIFQTFCGYNNIFERLADYYFHTSIVLIPMIFERGGKSESRLDTPENRKYLQYITLFICAFFIWRFLSTVNHSSTYMPYQFFWQR